jgi:hypothetical protein
VQHRWGVDVEWDDIPCSKGNNCLPEDIEVTNWKGARDVRVRFFNQLVVCFKTLVTVIITVDEKLKQRVRGD